jgi:elongation factor G
MLCLYSCQLVQKIILLGVVDLIKMKGIIWHMETEGMTFDEIDVPADMVEEANEWRAKLVEAVAEYDDTLMEKFFDDPNSITEDEMHEAIRKACIDLSIVPMMCGSSFKNKGVQTALDAVCRYLPSPVDVEDTEGINPDTGETVYRKPDAKEPFAALAFKIMTDPFVGRLAFFRCYSGHLDAGSYVLNVRSGKKERISRIMKMFANKQNPVDFIEAGDIAAAVGFKEIKTGDTLCDENILSLWRICLFQNQLLRLLLSLKLKQTLIKWVWQLLNWLKKILLYV